MSTSIIIKRLIGVVAAVALTLGIGGAAAAPASAASTVWDRVAKCESGGNWKINTGNGYYGGLQFSRSTWKGYGGGKYASTANKASKAEQIAIARRVLRAQGPGAWPVCSRRAGLSKSNGNASSKATPSSNPGAKKTTSSKASVKKKATAKKKSTASSTKSKTSSAKTAKVKRGDTLRKIAKRYHVQGGWKALWKLNRKTLKNPNTIYIGQVLKIKK